MTDATTHTRRLNDLARSQPTIANATWVMTEGVAALLSDDEGKVLPDRLNALRRALAGFNTWPDGDDPYCEHDFGAFDLFGQRLFFKIDYVQPDHDTLSPVPSSIELCRRVLTIMLGDEY